MDIELIIYLIFLAVALLSRFLNKKKNSAPTSGDPQQPARPAKSFEELLEEFTNPAPEPVQKTVRAPQPQKKREREPFRETDFSFESQDELRTIDELVDIKKTRTTTRLVAPDAPNEEEEVLDIQGMFEDPESARKAIILSEILNRKYS